MTEGLNYSFFTAYGKYFSPIYKKTDADLPFKHHTAFPLIVDILSRKHCHHLVLCSEFSLPMRIAFMEAFLSYLTNEQHPHYLRAAELICLDIENLPPTKLVLKQLEKDFQNLCDSLAITEQFQLLALTSIKPFAKTKSSDQAFIQNELKRLLSHPKCRLFIFADLAAQDKYAKLSNHFHFLNMDSPSEKDIFMLLKQACSELEIFHRVKIPEDLFSYAYALSHRFLSTQNTFEKTLLLLDSSAARASLSPKDRDSIHNQTLTAAELTAVLSHWTNIPTSHLQLNQFKLREFTQEMQHQLFGQDAAVTSIGQAIMQSETPLQTKHSPFLSLLFAGPKHAGKKTAAIALVDQLFKQPNILFYAQLESPALQSLAAVKVLRSVDRKFFALKDIIRNFPYAVILFEDIEQTSPGILDELHEILTTGFLYDNEGNQYNFCQAIIILSTQLGSHPISVYTKTVIEKKELNEGGLMQLVIGKQVTDSANHMTQSFSPQELTNEILAEITAQLPQSVCDHVTIVPFLPLTQFSIEKIIHLKIKELIQQLAEKYTIELSYAPEVVRYLSNEVVKNETQGHVVEIEKAIKLLYFSVEQALLNKVQHPHRSKQLFLQLNETGQLLRCDWLNVGEPANAYGLI